MKIPLISRYSFNMNCETSVLSERNPYVCNFDKLIFDYTLASIFTLVDKTLNCIEKPAPIDPKFSKLFPWPAKWAITKPVTCTGSKCCRLPLITV